jgi:hypothetical protein
LKRLVEEKRPSERYTPSDFHSNFALSITDDDLGTVREVSAVGSLMYAMVCSRLDIAHAVGVLNRYMSKLGKEHWTTVKRVFRNLRGIGSYGLCYKGRP